MRVLMVGETAETADFADPAIPPGMTAEKIRAGIDLAMSDMRGRGWEPVLALVPPDVEAACAQVREALGAGPYDCVVIGGGLRLPRSRVAVFESLVNLVRREAPQAALAFNTSPESTADAAARATAASGGARP